MQTKSDHQTEQMYDKVAIAPRRLIVLVLATLLGLAGLFTNARPAAAVGASGLTVGAGTNFPCYDRQCGSNSPDDHQ